MALLNGSLYGQAGIGLVDRLGPGVGLGGCVHIGVEPPHQVAIGRLDHRKLRTRRDSEDRIIIVAGHQPGMITMIASSSKCPSIRHSRESGDDRYRPDDLPMVPD